MAQIRLEHIGKRFTVYERPPGRFGALKGLVKRQRRIVRALEDVSFSNIVLDNAGRFLRVDATIHLVEYVPPTTTVSEKKQTQAGTSGSNAGALAASPSTTDKSNKAPTTHSGGGGGTVRATTK